MTVRHLLVTNDFPPKVGGIQSYLWELWRRLDPTSFTVLTATSDPEAGAFDAEQRLAGFDIVRVPAQHLYLPTPRATSKVKEIAADQGASLVILDPALPLGMLGRRLGLPYGVVLHGAEVTIPGHIPGTDRMLKTVLQHASLVISAGGYPAAEARRVARGNLPTTVEVPPGVDCERFRPIPPNERSEIRQKLGLPPDGHLVVSVSRLVPRKGMDTLIEAAAQLGRTQTRTRTEAQRHPHDLTVAIAGDGRDRPRLERLARRAGAPVRFLGRIPESDKALLLGAADLFVMACRNRWGGLEQEGFGIVFAEAAAAGVPQVAGDSGGAAEAVAHGETGLVVRHPRRWQAVAEAIRVLLADDDRRQAMGAEARRRAVASFDYARLAPRLAAALAEVPATAGPRSARSDGLSWRASATGTSRALVEAEPQAGPDAGEEPTGG